MSVCFARRGSTVGRRRIGYSPPCLHFFFLLYILFWDLSIGNTRSTVSLGRKCMCNFLFPVPIYCSSLLLWQIYAELSIPY